MGSIDVAFAVMVLEHLADPARFWGKLWEVLRPRGVFWGLTIDARHWFCHASLFAERLKLKDLYLNVLFGKRGTQRYENYPTYYRTNSPQQILPCVRRFRSCEFINFAREGQLRFYFPRVLHPLANWLDRRAVRNGQPGALLAVRVVK